MGNSKGMKNLCILKYHYVYQIKNNINGKLYIGRHSTNYLNDNYFGSGSNLKKAIKKYGRENFTLTIIKFFNSYLEAVEEEARLVTRDWCKRTDTYNIVEGGHNPVMYKEDNPAWKGGVTEARKIKKGRRSIKGSLNPMFNKTHTQEAREKIRQANIGRTPASKGKKLTPEERNSHIKNQVSRKCISIFGVKFPSIRSAARELNTTQQFIQLRVKSDKYEDYIFIDEIITDVPSREEISSISDLVVKITSIEVDKMDINGNYICTYKSIKEAARENHASARDISIMCKYGEKDGYKMNHIKGFKWAFSTGDTRGDVRSRGGKGKKK